MAKVFDRVKVVSQTVGTGALALGAAMNSFQSFNAAGAVVGDVVNYVIEEGLSWEIGTGVLGMAVPVTATLTYTVSSLTSTLIYQAGLGSFTLEYSIGATSTLDYILSLGSSTLTPSGDTSGSTLAWDASVPSTSLTTSGSTLDTTVQHDASQTATLVPEPVSGSTTVTREEVISAAGPTLTRTVVASSNGNAPLDLSGSAHVFSAVVKSDVDGKAPTIHIHAIANVTGLQGALDGKAPAAHTHPVSDVTGLQTVLDGKAATVHVHAVSDVTGLQAVLDGKAEAAHIHTIANITGLQGALDGKSAAGHSHAYLPLTGGLLTGGLLVGPAGTGTISLNPGTPDRPGYIGLFTPDGTRRGYIGFGDGANSWQIVAENGWSIGISGVLNIGNSLNFGSTVRQMINLYGVGFGLGVQANTLYLRTSGSFIVYKGGAHGDAEGNAGAGGSMLFYVRSDGAVWSALHGWFHDAFLARTSLNRPGVTRLYRRDEDSGFNVQTNWDGARWWLRGYLGDILHAECRVGYSDMAGSLNPAAGHLTPAAWQFDSHNNGSVNSGSAPLQAYASGGGSAFMSFHRASAFAVNFGLDTDNVLRIGGWSAAANRLQLDMSGNLTLAGDVTAFSDRRLKSKIRTIDGALDLVTKLRGVRFVKDGKENLGVIAQEVQEVFPELVHTSNDGTLSVALQNLVGVLIEAIKELAEERR